MKNKRNIKTERNMDNKTERMKEIKKKTERKKRNNKSNESK